MASTHHSIIYFIYVNITCCWFSLLLFSYRIKHYIYRELPFHIHFVILFSCCRSFSALCSFVTCAGARNGFFGKVRKSALVFILISLYLTLIKCYTHKRCFCFLFYLFFWFLLLLPLLLCRIDTWSFKLNQNDKFSSFSSLFISCRCLFCCRHLWLRVCVFVSLSETTSFLFNLRFDVWWRTSFVV